MPESRSPIFTFGPFCVLTEERRLERDGTPVRLGGRTLDLLIVLLERAGEVVPNRVLLESVWGGVTVEDGTLRFHIKTLRRVLGDNRGDTRYVVNVSGRGYSFAARVERRDRDEAPRPSAGPSNRQANLPMRTSPIVGRAENIEALSRDLSQRRLVTVAGPGGIGKTTLAIATAQALRASFNDTVFFVDLAPITDPALVVSTLATALKQAQRSEDPAGALLDELGDRRVLIVLDNCEQVIEAVAALADRIIREAAGTHILVTSRETLRIEGEHVHRLMPLESPPTRNGLSAEEAMSYAAVQLLVDRVAGALGGFTLDDELAPVAGEICRRLDGIPLAIELAAARVELFGFVGLARGLNNMFAVLTEGRRFALPRHQTLRAALDWSYQLLSPAEQGVLQGISMFRTTFNLDSVLALVQGLAIQFEDAVAAMASLVSKSMVTTARTGEVVQYRLLEVTRIYASEKLAVGGSRPAATRRHAELHLELLQAAPANWELEAGRAWLRAYAGRIDDIRAALDWCFSDAGDLTIGLGLMVASARFWFQLSLTLECRSRIEAALQRLYGLPEREPAMEMQLQAALGYALWYSAGGADHLERAFERALSLAEQLGDSAVHLQALWGMWASRRLRGRYWEALALAKRYASVARTSGDEAAETLGDRILALTHHHLGEQREARVLSERVLAGARRTGNALSNDFQLSPEIAAATMLTRILWLQGFPDQAAARLREAVEAAQGSDHWFSMYYVVCFAGCPFALWIGNLQQAKRDLELVVNRGAADRWRRCWLSVLRMRQSGRSGALIAASFEPRVDLSTAEALSAQLSAAEIPVPDPDDDVGEALWAEPEVLRVNAELLLWHNGPDACAAAEAQLLRSLDLARQQSALSWELRAATTLAHLRHRVGRTTDGRDLLAATYGRFTEGFGTEDLARARQMLADWS